MFNYVLRWRSYWIFYKNKKNIYFVDDIQGSFQQTTVISYGSMVYLNNNWNIFLKLYLLELFPFGHRQSTNYTYRYCFVSGKDKLVLLSNPFWRWSMRK